ncbi:MAG: ribonuclease HII [Brevinematia bacterium]
MKFKDLTRLLKQFDYVVGIDEVGRGCIAGPMLVCAVIVDPSIVIEGVKDSKLLSPGKREKLLPEITKRVYDIGVGFVSNKEIDSFGIGIALRIAILKSLINLKFLPRLIITDYVDIKSKRFEDFLLARILPKEVLGKYLDIYSKLKKFDGKVSEDGFSYYLPIKKADRYVHANSIASVVAKVLRDRYMRHVSVNYPEYRLDKNKGYCTRDHTFAIKKYGFSEIHRTSFVLKKLGNSRELFEDIQKVS